MQNPQQLLLTAKPWMARALSAINRLSTTPKQSMPNTAHSLLNSHGEKKQTVLEKLGAFFERFFGLL
ncbi:MAG: hypothetical protein HQ523_02400 [Lentisphaerae bacterium]|nr:hypothetical protein [Lentisphaerota bacterium]